MCFDYVETLKKLRFNNIEEVSDFYSELLILKSGLFDLVIVEGLMTNMNRLEFLIQNRYDPNLKQIPVLIVFEDKMQEKIVAVFKAGLNGYVLKSVELISFAEKKEEIFK